MVRSRKSTQSRKAARSRRGSHGKRRRSIRFNRKRRHRSMRKVSSYRRKQKTHTKKKVGGAEPVRNLHQGRRELLRDLIRARVVYSGFPLGSIERATLNDNLVYGFEAAFPQDDQIFALDWTEFLTALTEQPNRAKKVFLEQLVNLQDQWNLVCAIGERYDILRDPASTEVEVMYAQTMLPNPTSPEAWLKREWENVKRPVSASVSTGPPPQRRGPTISAGEF